MKRLLLAFTIALAGIAAAGAAADPLQSPECRSALEAMQRREAALAAAASAPASVPAAPASATAGPGTSSVLPEQHRTRAADARLEKLRREAARACLASRADAPAPTPQRLAQPPLAVPPVAGPPLHAPSRATGAASALPAGPVPVPRPAAPIVVTTCDATGCWTSDGRRLDRAGPNLLGPRGLCTLQGALLQCP
jgi:hypothetical protein